MKTSDRLLANAAHHDRAAGEEDLEIGILTHARDAEIDHVRRAYLSALLDVAVLASAYHRAAAARMRAAEKSLT